MFRAGATQSNLRPIRNSTSPKILTQLLFKMHRFCWVAGVRLALGLGLRVRTRGLGLTAVRFRAGLRV